MGRRQRPLELSGQRDYTPSKSHSGLRSAELPGSLDSFVESLEKLTAKFEADKARHVKRVALVERMLEMNKQKARCSAGLRPADAAHRAALQQGATGEGGRYVGGGDTAATTRAHRA